MTDKLYPSQGSGPRAYTRNAAISGHIAHTHSHTLIPTGNF